MLIVEKASNNVEKSDSRSVAMYVQQDNKPKVLTVTDSMWGT